MFEADVGDHFGSSRCPYRDGPNLEFKYGNTIGKSATLMIHSIWALWAPRRPRKQLQKFGGFAPHTLEWLRKPPGPHSPPKSASSGWPTKNHLSKPRCSEGVARHFSRPDTPDVLGVCYVAGERPQSDAYAWRPENAICSVKNKKAAGAAKNTQTKACCVCVHLRNRAPSLSSSDFAAVTE